MSNAHKFTLVIVSICFGVGAVNHVKDIVHGGIFPYHMVPMPINVYWTSLALLDLLTIGLLWTHVRLGLGSALVVMLSDVAINTYVYFALNATFGFVPLQLQTMFLGFLLGCTVFLWSHPQRRGAVQAERDSK